MPQRPSFSWDCLFHCLSKKIYTSSNNQVHIMKSKLVNLNMIKQIIIIGLCIDQNHFVINSVLLYDGK